MAKKKRALISISGYRIPDFDKVKKDNKNFAREFSGAMQYAHNEFNNKKLKSETITYYASQGKDVTSLRTVEDYEFVVPGKLCYILNNGGDLEESCYEHIDLLYKNLVTRGKRKKEITKIEDKETNPKPKNLVNIQDHLRTQASVVAAEFDEWVDEFIKDPNKFQTKNKDPLSKMKGASLKAGHVRHIIDFYKNDISELNAVLEDTCPQLKEAYECYSKPQIKKILSLYEKIKTACDMIIESAKVTRKPRAKKAVSKDKIVEKLKYQKEFASLGLVSINPIDILGAQELWVYNTKTRKIGKFIALDAAGLQVNKAAIENFAEKSIQKRLRKPDEQVKEFKKAGKVALRTFLDKIKAVDTKMKGRLNENHILLKVIK